MPNRRKNEVLEDILNAGGADPYVGAGETDTKPKSFPSSFNRIVQYMLKLSYRLRELVDKEIPQAFPITEQKGRGDPRYKHSSAERLHSRPVTILKDANLSLEVCVEVKQILSAAKTLFASFYPKRIENRSFSTQVKDGFQDDVRRISGYLENIEKIHNKILRSKSSSLTQTVDFKGLEKLKNHLIKIGHETKRGKELIEVFPNVLTVRDAPGNGSRSLPPQRGRSLGDSKIEELACKLSDRLFDGLSEDDQE